RLQYQKHRTLYLALGLTILACLGVWFSTPFAMRLVAATLLAFFLPGWLLLQAVGFIAEDRSERVVLAFGASYGLTVLGSLGVLYTAGRLSAPLVIGVLGLTSLVLAVVGVIRPGLSGDSPSPTRLDFLFFVIPVAVAAYFSFTRLGYSDYWGDEMNGLLRAVSIIAGRRETLFEHTKGPVEVLLPAVFGLLVGRFEPFTLRFPFALAHTVGVGGYYLLARRLFGRNVGLVSALLSRWRGKVPGAELVFGRHRAAGSLRYAPDTAADWLPSLAALRLALEGLESRWGPIDWGRCHFSSGSCPLLPPVLFAPSPY
ncbi:MAG: glycosyltransferase family 39 protein, partial [Anaerolineae bacterium]